MVKLFLSLLFSGTLFSYQARLNIIVTNVEVGKGNVVVEIYDNEKTFLKKSIATQVAKATAENLEFSFSIPRSECAVAVYQDINENKTIDQGLLGIPKEPYGFSNNYRPRFVSPRYRSCVIRLLPLTTQTITLKRY